MKSTCSIAIFLSLAVSSHSLVMKQDVSDAQIPPAPPVFPPIPLSAGTDACPTAEADGTAASITATKAAVECFVSKKAEAATHVDTAKDAIIAASAAVTAAQATATAAVETHKQAMETHVQKVATYEAIKLQLVAAEKAAAAAFQAAVDACADRIELKGAEDLKRPFMAVYYRSKLTPIAKNGGRSIYSSANGNNVYYWEGRGWLVDKAGGFTNSDSIIYSGSQSICPEDGTDWNVWNGEKWLTLTPPVTVTKVETKVCPKKITITGGGALQDPWMGDFTKLEKTAGDNRRGRPVYENGNGKRLYFWADDNNWLIDDKVLCTSPTTCTGRTAGTGVVYSSTTTECPSDAKGWRVVDTSAALDLTITVVEAGTKYAWDDAATQSTEVGPPAVATPLMPPAPPAGNTAR